jgi:hypothetical protein
MGGGATWRFSVESHGAVISLVPLTKLGRDWIERNMGGENGAQPFYQRGRVIVMETRY